MANCVCNMFKGLWSFIVRILRVALVIFCGLELLASVIAIWSVYVTEKYASEFDFPGLSVSFTSYVSAIALGLISFVGAHGAYSKDARYLKVFALSIAIYAIVTFLGFITDVTTTDWDAQNKKFVDQMTDYADKYQFDLLPGQTANKATRAWDLVQKTLFCCGLKGPKDWDKWELVFKKKPGTLPRSCCLNLPRLPAIDKCTIGSEELSDVGCLQRIDAIMTKALAHELIDPLWYLLLAAVAIIVAKRHDPDVSPNQPHQTQRNPQQYQRFEGSVYVRQPPVNEAFTGSDIPKVNSTAPLYPTAHEEKHSSPPPRYS